LISKNLLVASKILQIRQLHIFKSAIYDGGFSPCDLPGEGVRRQKFPSAIAALHSAKCSPGSLEFVEMATMAKWLVASSLWLNKKQPLVAAAVAAKRDSRQEAYWWW
jgi:hypothetical protein